MAPKAPSINDVILGEDHHPGGGGGGVLAPPKAADFLAKIGQNE